MREIAAERSEKLGKNNCSSCHGATTEANTRISLENFVTQIMHASLRYSHNIQLGRHSYRAGSPAGAETKLYQGSLA